MKKTHALLILSPIIFGIPYYTFIIILDRISDCPPGIACESPNLFIVLGNIGVVTFIPFVLGLILVTRRYLSRKNKETTSTER